MLGGPSLRPVDAREAQAQELLVLMHLVLVCLQ